MRLYHHHCRQLVRGIRFPMVPMASSAEAASASLPEQLI